MTDDSDFERRLLASSRHDGPSPADTARALRTFLASVEIPAPETPPGGASPHTAIAAASIAGPARWILVGALGGSLLTLGLTEALRAGTSASDSSASDRSPAVITTGAPPTPQAIVASSPSSPPSPSSSPTPTNGPTRSAPPIVAPRPLASSATASSAPPTASAVAAAGSSRLAEEVARIDAARDALSRGAHDDALALVASYRQAFPAGQLARDAEVVAIEALHAKGLVTEASERASTFLARYPADPQADRVRALVH